MKRLLIIVGVLSVILALAGGLLFHSTFGLRLALETALSDADSLVLEGLRGSLRNGLTAKRIRLEMDGTQVDLQSVQLPWELNLGNATLVLEPGRLESLAVRVRAEAASGESATPIDLRLPMTLIARDLVVERIEVFENGESLWVADAVRIKGNWQDDRLSLEHLAWQDVAGYRAAGRVSTSAPHTHDLEATIDPGSDSAPVRLRLSGTVDETSFVLKHTQFQAQGTLGSLLYSLHYEAEIQASLGPDISAAGQVRGTLDQFELDASLDLAQTRVSVERMRARVGTDSLAIDNGHLTWLEQGLTADLTGTVRYDGKTDVQGDWTAEAGRWSDQLSRFAGNFKLSSDLTTHQIVLSGRGSASGQTVFLEMSADAGSDAVSISRLSLETSAGAASLNGTMDLETPYAFRAEGTLAGLDLSLLGPAFESRLDGMLTLAGNLPETGANLELGVRQLGGEFLGRPVAGEVETTIESGKARRLVASIASGSSQVDLNIPDWDHLPWQASARVQDLGSFWPEAVGQLNLDLRGRAPVTDLNATGRFSGSELILDRYSLKSLSGEFDGRWDPSQPFVLDAQWAGLGIGGEGELGGDVHLEGDGKRLSLTTTAHSRYGTVEMDLGFNPKQPERLQLQRLQTLTLSGESWALDTPMELVLDASAGVGWEGDLCLEREAARLCAAHDPAGHYGLSARQVPLAIAGPYLLLTTGTEMDLSGTLDGQAKYDQSSGGPAVLEVRFSVADLRMPSPHDPQTPIHLDRLTMEARGTDPMELDLALHAGGSSATLKGMIHEPFTEPRMELVAQVDFPQISDAMDLGGRRATTISGALQGTVMLEGDPGSPRYRGRISGRQLALPLPRLGNAARDGRFDLDFQQDGALAFSGQFELKEGSVVWQGSGSIPIGGHPTGTVNITTRNALLVDDPALDLRADSDLTLTVQHDRIELGGRVVIGESSIRIGPIESTVPASRDVVYTDTLEAPQEASLMDLPLQSELEVVTGKPIRVTGFGLDGQLDGELTVFDGPNEPTSALGELNVTGRYSSYGQALNISRGRLSYARTPLENPALDIEATRTTPAGLVGVRVSGLVSAPDISLFSSPAMDESEILSNLVLGQSLGNSGATTSGAVSAALFGLSATGFNAPGRQIVQLDFNDEVGGAALRVGRFLSPKLYLDYTFGLLEQLDVLSLSYQLSPNWSVRTQVSTEVQTSINYQIETGRPEAPANQTDR